LHRAENNLEYRNKQILRWKDIAMKITLGLRLDGEVPPFPQNTVGAVWTGPSGFLQVMETRLGLGGIYADKAIRVAQYR
jgi:hypothetical protein